MPKIVDHDATRRELASRAIPVFSEAGYGTVTMRQLADALEVSTGTVYHYFGSKEQLFEHVVRAAVDLDAEAAEAAFALEPGQVLDLSVSDLVGWLTALDEGPMRRVLVLLDYWRLHPEGRDRLRPVLEEARGRYARVVAALLGSRSEALGTLMLGALFNLLQQRWLHGPDFDLSPQVRILERMVASERAREPAV